MSLDILIFAGVAIFLLFRLKDILGRDEGKGSLDHPFDALRQKKEREKAEAAADQENDDDQSYDPHRSPEATSDATAGDNVVPLNQKVASARAAALHDDPEVDAVLRDIRKLDPSFHPDDFMQGAEAAYEMVINGYARGDLTELRGLMSQSVFEDFKSAIDSRADAGETLETTLVGFDEVKIVAASLEDKTAELDVLYTTQQINVIRDQDGEPLEGQEAIVQTQVDEWTLVRKMTSRDPNWTLVSLSEVEPED